MSQATHASGSPGDPGLGPGLDAEELTALRDSVRGVCSRRWPSATTAQEGDVAALWRVAADQGWTDFGDPALAGAAIAVQEELGRVGCPLPVVDVALAASVHAARGAADIATAIAAGTARPVIAHAPLTGGPVVARHVEAAAAATHLLVVDEAGGRLGWFAMAGAEVTVLPGLPAPAWSAVRPAAGPDWTEPLSEHPDLLMVRRLGLAARAVAAVARTHELAVEHARQRRAVRQARRLVPGSVPSPGERRDHADGSAGVARARDAAARGRRQQLAAGSGDLPGVRGRPAGRPAVRRSPHARGGRVLRGARGAVAVPPGPRRSRRAIGDRAAR